MLAERLGVRTTGEGVKTVETQSSVTGLGCKQAQSYRFGQVMPAQGFPAYLAAEFIAAGHSATSVRPSLAARWIVPRGARGSSGRYKALREIEVRAHAAP